MQLSILHFDGFGKYGIIGIKNFTFFDISNFAMIFKFVISAQ